MEEYIDLEEAQLNISFCINGQVHLVAMDKDKLDAIAYVLKSAVDHVIKTNRSQQELLKFLGLEE